MGDFEPKRRDEEQVSVESDVMKGIEEDDEEYNDMLTEIFTIDDGEMKS